MNVSSRLLAVTAPVVLFATFGSARPAHADKTVSLAFGLPVHASGSVSMLGCTNSGGPEITIDGKLKLSGLQADVIFYQNTQHNGVVEVKETAVLVDFGTEITIPKQPVLGGVGGNPHIWLQFVDKNGKGLTDKVYLGRCVQGQASLDVSFLASVLAAMTVSADSCQNSPGPYITLGDGTLTFSGAKARLIFQNADNPVGGPHKASTKVVDVEVILTGFAIEVPKQPVLGGFGGNPYISIQFKQSSGALIGSPISLGRCNKI